MTKEELIKKLAERNAAKQTEQQQPESTTESATQTGQAKAKLKSFTIIWHEGTGEFDGKTVHTWKKADDMMQRIYNRHSGEGYTKVKINVLWENGAEITDRADCSDSTGDYCGNRETIGQYLSRQNSVMYGSNLKIGDRANLSFEDETPQAKPQPTANEVQTEEVKTNLSEIPELLNKLIGIVETIEESDDRSETALIKASEQVERAKAYSLYLQAITPILEAKVNAMIEAQHRGKIYKTNIQRPANENLN